LICAEEVSDRWLFVDSYASKNCLHLSYPFIIPYVIKNVKHKRKWPRFYLRHKANAV
jgi:hypothetical protein